VWDINLAYSAFHAAKQLNCETWMVGYNPADPDPGQPDTVMVDGVEVHSRSEKSREVKGKWAKVVDHHQRWVVPDEFHRVPLPFDISIAPLWLNDMTCGKSDIKAIEAACAGAVSVLARNPAYTHAGWKDGVNCLLANSPEEYGTQTVRLIKDRPLREELLAAAQELVRETRNETHMRAEWTAALAL
jgi:hypothetical protein